MLELEREVPRFPRRHRYSLGQDLRGNVLEAALLSHEAFRAVRDPQRHAALVSDLVEAVDRLKLRLQLGQQLQVFVSFARFEEIIRIADDLGRQCGGLQRKIRQQHPNGQNPAASRRPERPETLSTRAALIEAQR